MKRTTLRRKSKKQAALEREHADARREYKERWHLCPWCGRREVSDVHEIIGGSDRHKTFTDPRYWLPTCRICHDRMQGEPKARGFARKVLLDDGHFELSVLNAIPGKIVTDEELLREIAKFYREAIGA